MPFQQGLKGSEGSEHIDTAFFVAKAGVQAGMRCCINKAVSISSNPVEPLLSPDEVAAPAFA